MQDESETTFISKKVEVVDRFVAVHAQILLNQFKNYPVASIKVGIAQDIHVIVPKA